MKYFSLIVLLIVVTDTHAGKFNTRLDLFGARSFHPKSSSKEYWAYYPLTYVVQPIVQRDFPDSDDHWGGNTWSASVGYQGFLGELELAFGTTSLAEIKTRIDEIGVMYHAPKLWGVHLGIGYNYYNFSKSTLFGNDSFAPVLSCRWGGKRFFLKGQYYIPFNENNKGALSMQIGLRVFVDTRPAWQQTGFEDED